MKNNLILIGMAGAGKSVIGREIAKKLGMNFIDTDNYIEEKEGKKIQNIIDEYGDKVFKEIEKKRIEELGLNNCVVSTGGSVVLSPNIMDFLKENGKIIFLDVPLDIIKRRLKRGDRRIVGIRTSSLENIFEFRLPLYRKYADIIIDTTNKNKEEIVKLILEKIKLKELKQGIKLISRSCT